jgi:hypothetical protein
MTARDLPSAIRVSFSCGPWSGYKNCARCGKHRHCRGQNPSSLICLACYEALEHEWPDYKGEGTAA